MGNTVTVREVWFQFRQVAMLSGRRACQLELVERGERQPRQAQNPGTRFSEKRRI